MYKLAIALLIAAISTPVAAFTDIMELQRIRVTHCTIEGYNPPVVVVTPEVYEDFGFDLLPEDQPIPVGVTVNIDVEGEPTAEVGCRTYDSRVNASDYEGRLVIYSDDQYVIEELIYSAVYRTGSAVFSAADWAFTNFERGNGAVYNVESTLLQESNGAALDYDIGFLRRGAPTSDDPVTIMRIQREMDDGIVIFELDFKSANKE